MTFFYCAAAITLFIILCVVVIYHDPHYFVVRNYELESDKIKGDHTFVLPFLILRLDDDQLFFIEKSVVRAGDHG